MDGAGGVMAISSTFLLLLLFAVEGLIADAGWRSESTALTVRPEGRQFHDRAWREILDVLIAQAGEVESIVDEA